MYSLFFRFLLYYPLYLLIVLVHVIFSLFLHKLLLVPEQLHTLLPQLFHFVQRRTSLSITLTVSVILYLVYFSLLSQKLIFIHYLRLHLHLLHHFLVPLTSEYVSLIHSEGKLTAHINGWSNFFLFRLARLTEDTK